MYVCCFCASRMLISQGLNQILLLSLHFLSKNTFQTWGDEINFSSMHKMFHKALNCNSHSEMSFYLFYENIYLNKLKTSLYVSASAPQKFPSYESLLKI